MTTIPSYLQTSWDSLLLHSFFLNNHDKEQSLTMRQLLSQYETHLVNHGMISSSTLDDQENTYDNLFNLSLKRFPINHSSQLDCSCIHFVSGFLPELGQLLWKKQNELQTKKVEQLVSETLPFMSQLKYDIQEQDENSHHSSLNSEHRQQNRAQVARNIISLNRKLKENSAHSGLNWTQKKH